MHVICRRPRDNAEDVRVGNVFFIKTAGHQRSHNIKQRWQPLGDGRWGRVVGREGADRSVRQSHDVLEGIRFTNFGEGLNNPTNYHSRPTNNELQVCVVAALQITSPSATS